MNKGILTVGVILLSAIALILISIVSNYSTGSELDYYLLKETTEAAMYDAVDPVFYQQNGLLRIDREKFVESFLCRFADAIDINNRVYTVGFYDINETPPKVSVKIDTKTVLSYQHDRVKFSTAIDAILENNYQENIYVEKALHDETNDLGYPIGERGKKKSLD